MKFNKKLSSEEKIERVEMAPEEMQTAVAKAFIRDDIKDEDIQFTFNTDSLEELNDPEENTEIENKNAEAPEGIGASSFSMRVYKPGKGNKNYIRRGTGGWSTCCKGYPQDPDCNVLANCVGYASGRFNEIINEIRDTAKCTYTTLNCNAENFIERAKAAGLETGSTPRIGAIMCWRKGTTASYDGAGHVAIVEKIYDNNHVYTSESGYGSTAFWNQHRYNNNGRWGLSKSYTFREFIYLPKDVQKVIDEGNKPIPEPTPCEKFNIGDEVIINGPLYVSSNAEKPVGNAKNKQTKITRKACGSAHPYNTTGDLGWMNEADIKKYVAPEPPKPTPEPKPEELKVGDTVKIIGTGNGSSYGKSNTAYGLGWTRTILKIYNGRPYPYQVGNSTATTGFYKAEALQKK